MTTSAPKLARVHIARRFWFISGIVLLAGGITSGVAAAGGTSTPPQHRNPATVGGVSAVVSYGESFQAGQSNAPYAEAYSGWCAAWSAQVYGASGSGKRTAQLLATSLTLHKTRSPANAPKGALVFFTDGITGHVGIATGTGWISANESAPWVFVRGVTSRWTARYEGWAYPPPSWGSLAQQAASTINSELSPPPISSSSNTTQAQAPPLSVRTTAPAPPVSVTGPPSSGSVMVTTGGGGSGLAQASQTSAVNLQPAAGITALTPGPAPGSGSSGSPTPTAEAQSPPVTTTPPSPPATVSEAVGPGPIENTYTNPTGPSGGTGLRIAANTIVQVVCRTTGTPEGRASDPWWYKLSTGSFFSADAACDEGATTCPSFAGTPTVDTKVPPC